MLERWGVLENRFEIFLLLFIIFQPILDLLTSFCIIVLKMSATVGIFVRLFVMLLGAAYILIKAREKENRRYFFYLAILGVVVLAGLLNNKMIKHPILIGEEIKFIAKVMYTFIMAGCYIVAFRSLRFKVNIGDRLKNSILYAMLIINVVMAISIVTNTDYNSYEYFKSGSRGWFFAGNELGAILAITFPVILLYSIEKTKQVQNIYYWIPSLLSIFSLFAVGTKVGYGAIVLSLGAALVMCFAQAFFNKKHNGNKKVLLLNGFVALAVLLGVGAYTPFSPIVKNTTVHVELIEQQQQKQKQEKEEAKKHGEEIEEPSPEEPPKDQVGGLLFSGRELFLRMHQAYFEEAPLSQKLLGMGYGGNFKTEPKLIERDFHDIFYDFGFIGFFIVLAPFVYYGVKLLIAVFRKFYDIFTVTYALLAVSMALALGIAYTAGHVLAAPAVSIYFVVIAAYVLVSLEIE
ncbi:MAG: O-antigen ligase family protein [Ectobacillus sp.]